VFVSLDVGRIIQLSLGYYQLENVVNLATRQDEEATTIETQGILQCVAHLGGFLLGVETI